MEQDKVKKILDLIKRIEITEENKDDIKEIKNLIKSENYTKAMKLLQKISKEGKIKLIQEMKSKEILIKENDSEKVHDKEQEHRFILDEEENDEDTELYEDDEYEEDKELEEDEEEDEEDVILQDKKEGIYPNELSNDELEEQFVSLLLLNPKAISMYYILYEDCYFENKTFLNLYKSVLFTEGEAYAPQIAKNDYNFAVDGPETYELKFQLKEKAKKKKYDFEKTYVELRKLFEIRKNYLVNPIKETQDQIVGILKYELYDKMTIDEVKDAIEQIIATEKFKRAILSNDITNFLITGENNLTEGLCLPFPILSSVFKGVRKGETMAYAMPSNSGKSRFTINLAAYLAFIHQKKVLIISNEMSEEKMRLCLITTILNNKEIQKLHGQDITKTEGELLEFKFRPDKGVNVKIDEDGFILREKNEKQKDFAKRLKEVSSEFNKVIAVTEWIDKQIKNSIYFVNITNHTNDELEKVILNYYYKEKIEYVFYDTLKTDTENIGNGEELKKTATILSNLAQNLDIFIASSLQLAETNTLPINLNINDLAVSRTVKEVLDTLCLIKQIYNEDLSKYQYSLEEVDTKFYDLKKFEDPDVRYYACVVDKNRAGAKPKTVFRLNLAYNVWEELGYLRLKSE